MANVSWVKAFERQLSLAPVTFSGGLFFFQNARERQQLKKDLQTGREIYLFENEINSWSFNFPLSNDPEERFYLNYGLVTAVARVRSAILAREFPDRQFRVFVSNELVVCFEHDGIFRRPVPNVRTWSVVEDDQLWVPAYSKVADRADLVLDKESIQVISLERALVDRAPIAI